MKIAQWRLYIFLAIGMLILQSETTLANAAKMVYFSLTAYFLWRSVRDLRNLNPKARKKLHVVFVVAVTVLIFMVARAWLSILQGEEITRVVRDFFTYFMLCAAPFIGAAAGQKTTKEHAEAFVAAFTGVAAISFAVYWLANRGVSLLQAERLLMSSILLAALGVAVGGVYALVRMNPMWGLFAVFCFTTIAITGTRSGLVLILGVLASVGPLRKRRVPPARLALGIVVAAAITYITIPIISRHVARQGFIEDRFNVLLGVFDRGVTSDQSGAMRQEAFEIAYDTWMENPLLGVGFGHAFPNPVTGRVNADFQLDTGMVLIAKFGILGTAILLCAFVCLLWVFGSFHGVLGKRSESQAIGITFLLMCLLYMPLGSPTEDKGMAFGLSLIFYLLMANRHSRSHFLANKDTAIRLKRVPTDPHI